LECSTPKGIKGWDSSVAGNKSRKLTWCSTPKGIKGWDSWGIDIGNEIGTPCSTPKGIKGWDRRSPWSYWEEEKKCSTPKGIKGWDSWMGLSTQAPVWWSAQRQKASKVGTAELLSFGTSGLKACSTPKGIKGWDRSTATSKSNVVSLCSTPKGIKGWDRTYRRTGPANLRVLNAKRHQRLGQSGFQSTPMAELCAQRQKASKVGTGIAVLRD